MNYVKADQNETKNLHCQYMRKNILLQMQQQ